MMHYSQVLNGIAAFVDCDMIAKLNGSAKAWAVGATVAIAVKKAPAVLERLRAMPMVSALGLIDGEMIDVDTIYAALKDAASKAPTATIEIPLIGSVTYSATDIDALYRCIVGG